MEDFLDIVWFKIEILFRHIGNALDFVFSPLNSLGPAIAILIIAFITVAFAKYFTRKFKTKRYHELREKFVYWYNLRKDATICDDREKAKLLAKNIDQAKLNRLYYDYFLEGLLNNVLTMYLPILLLLAYVNETYKSSNMLELFGREYVFKFSSLNGKMIYLGAAFWFVISIVLVYIAWFIIGKLCSKYLKIQNPTT